ncbi:MAG: hypothetical protein AAB359_05830 [Elusimicrobiota bacterium]
MNSENEDASLFSKFKKAPKAQETVAPAPAQQPAPSQFPPARREDGKLAALETAVNELREELAALKTVPRKAPEPANPSPPPPGPSDGFVEELRRELTVSAEARKRSSEAEAELAVRLEHSENLIAGLKVFVSSQQAQLNKYVEQKLVSEMLGEYLRDQVAGLNIKVTEAGNSMNLSLSDMSARLTADEAVYGKMFSEAEDRVKRSLGGEIVALDVRLKKLRESVVWLEDEYRIVMERKIRALEGKYAAFEAISVRMDTISSALKNKC